MKKDVADLLMEISEIRALEFEARVRYEVLIQRVMMAEKVPEAAARAGVTYAHPPSSEKHN